MALQHWLTLTTILIAACTTTSGPPSSFHRENACIVLEKHALDLYANDLADETLIDDSEAARKTHRALFEVELRKRGTLDRLGAWCRSKLSETAFHCSMHASTTDTFEACQPR
jgi:hypothetical protein